MFPTVPGLFLRALSHLLLPNHAMCPSSDVCDQHTIVTPERLAHLNTTTPRLHVIKPPVHIPLYFHSPVCGAVAQWLTEWLRHGPKLGNPVSRAQIHPGHIRRQIWAHIRVLCRIKKLPVTHVLVDTWILTVKLVYKLSNVPYDLKWATNIWHHLH